MVCAAERAAMGILAADGTGNERPLYCEEHMRREEETLDV
jgi:hypothetical protein